MKGSIVYGVVVLGAPLIMVLEHSQCGAVKSALETQATVTTRVDPEFSRLG